MNFKIKSLALAISVASAVIAMPSSALIITNTVESSVIFSLNGVTQSDSSGPASSAASKFYGQTINPARNINPFSGGGYATGDDSGNSDLYSTGPAYTQIAWLTLPFVMHTESNVLHKAVLTNNSVSAQNIDFNFLITGGTVSASSEQLNDTNNYVQAGYTASILVNGSNRWTSAAKATHNGTGKSTVLSGTSLGGVSTVGGHYSDADYYTWNDYEDSLNLGWLAAGQSLTLEYSLSTYINEFFETDGYSYTPHASIGDPFHFNSSPLFAADKFVDASSTGTPSQLPEPAGIALLGLGVAALAFRRKSAKTRV